MKSSLQSFRIIIPKSVAKKVVTKLKDKGDITASGYNKELTRIDNIKGERSFMFISEWDEMQLNLYLHKLLKGEHEYNVIPLAGEAYYRTSISGRFYGRNL